MTTQLKEIGFDDFMIKLILDDKKTQTRRLIKQQLDFEALRKLHNLDDNIICFYHSKYGLSVRPRQKTTVENFTVLPTFPFNPPIFYKYAVGDTVKIKGTEQSIKIKKISVDYVFAISNDDAEKEGFASKDYFYDYFFDLYLSEILNDPIVWVIDFELIK